jgi:hypothetical protein
MRTEPPRTDGAMVSSIASATESAIPWHSIPFSVLFVSIYSTMNADPRGILSFSYVFGSVGLSQVMTRMGIDYMGLPAKAVPAEGPYSTRGVAFMFLGLWLTLNLIFAVVFWIKKKTGTQISLADIFACVIVNLCMYLYVVYATTNTRVVLRQRYRIKEFCCRNEVEDAFCAAACMPCVVSQMGRHTVSYIEHRGVCCSDTGLEPGVRADITARSHQGSYRIW